MNVIDFLQLLGITSATMIAVAVAIAFLGKYVIRYLYDSLIERKKKNAVEELEEFKSGLERDRRTFQHELDLKLDRYNVQFARLHEERAHIIKDMHAKLLELHSAISDYTAIARLIRDDEDPQKAEDARIERANKAIQDFNNYVLENCIYFEKSLAKKLDEIRQEYYSAAIDCMFIKQTAPDVGEKEYRKHIERWNEIINKISGDLQNALRELEDEFRQLLGVNS